MKGLLVVALAGLALGCASTGNIEAEKPAELPVFTPERTAEMLWRHDVGRGVEKHFLQLGPQIDGDVVYMVDRRGDLEALEAASGRRLWEAQLDVLVSAPVGVGDGLVLVATQKGELIALDSSNGAQRWKAALSTEVLAPAVSRLGTVVAQTGDGKLFALNAADGKRRWVFERTEPPLSLRGTSRPVILGDYVLSGFASGKIVALDLRDGRLLWELPVATPRGRNEIERLVDVDAPVLVVRDVLYAASYQGKIVAVDLRSGRINWSRDASVFNAMAADQRNLYVTEDKGIVLAVDQGSGAIVWRQDKLRGRRVSSPTIVDGYVAVGDFEGYVHWLSPEDGRFVARFRASPDPVRAPGVNSGGVLVVGDQGSAVTALVVR
jgi:outer membrane protein assembly factor BamB